ncbi:protein of unknown function (DUF4383) [Streptoalloteichus tenebrarius]|uniref:DUF4383 domain-containing protein n=1 Tax=Streptoalloteichus tenebrarius (strain ATCC 17920 / DSM 40477 / JCM 4838 / CBS 697.72 / NBRC 16177 / NCIMB 11028 / NRRL B-12390 / A12253. 1 / ISP 5477) TaxID=1933 RepID=A0ABT1HML0_STRSD|nr:DUF4383 domain-containing protein [Streptoalloteichus tenebrarius]MCP2256757.1 protein of unknown function (DUF4383) [Streptoalloteichus tenebrarius]BFF00338.1 hypothetical protein GCM10020241_20130 [Streptoalloteichus tenebrarius]
MKLDPYLPPDHPLSRIYRGGAALFGAGLVVFGVLGLAQRLPFITTNGVEIFGLATNGLLAVISIVVGAILVLAALRGGAAASTTTAVIGVLFFLSGLLNLAVLNSSFNILAFKIQNVVFSLVAGMLLTFLGLYGRVTGGLREDNPFVRYRHHEPPDADHSEELAAERRRLDEIEDLARAELAVAEGTATPEQELTVRAERARRAREARADAYRRTHAEVPGAANNPYY